MVTKLAFLFLTMAEGSNERSWLQFFKNQQQNYTAYVHSRFESVGVEQRIRESSRWESWIRSTINLLNEALTDSDNKKFIFLSETTLPGQSFYDVYSTIMNNPLPIFEYMTHASLRSLQNTLPWIVLDRSYAERLAESEEYLREQVHPYDNKQYPPTFLNWSHILKKTAYDLGPKRMNINNMVKERESQDKKPKIKEKSGGLTISEEEYAELRKENERRIKEEKEREEKAKEEKLKQEKAKALLDIYSVDFDQSMGKHDPYMHTYYEKCLEKAFDFWHEIVSPQPPSEFFGFLKNIYERNKLNKIKPGTSYRIPPTFHQIWIGGKPLPEKYKKWQRTWKSVPGWRYKLWTDEDAEKFPLVNRALFEQEKNMGVRADILRMEILYQEGGVYIDTDFECLKPEIFDLFNKSYDFYTGITPLDGEIYYLANGLIASVPGHPILKGYIDMRATVQPPKGMGKCTAITYKGPGLFTKMALLYGNKGYRDMFLPPTFVYPLAIYPPKPKGPLSRKQGYLAHLMDSEAGQEQIKKLVIKPESIAIHWWEGAWAVQDGKELC